MHIPQKRAQKQLIGFLYPEEILEVFRAVDLKRPQGFRDYTILHLLYDSGARAAEVATLNLDYFDCHNKTLAILGKRNRFRQITLWPKTTSLIERYISQYRIPPKPLYRQRVFINQRREEFTRHGIYRLCKKYLERALSPKRLKHIHPVHSFRHSCAVRMLCAGDPVSDIKNHLGHEDIQSTMVYLQMDLTRRRQVQKKFLQYTQAVLTQDPKIDELIDWQNRTETLAWLDSL
jgi:integrase/recombinase XerD